MCNFLEPSIEEETNTTELIGSQGLIVALANRKTSSMAHRLDSPSLNTP
jgi:hypothetical protein